MDNFERLIVRSYDRIIQDSTSMDDKEKTYWKNEIRGENKELAEGIINICIQESIKLETLEDNYEKEYREMEARHLKEWEEILFKNNLS